MVRSAAGESVERIEVKRKRLDDGYGQNYERQTGAQTRDERSGCPSADGQRYTSGCCERFAKLSNRFSDGPTNYFWRAAASTATIGSTGSPPREN